MGASSYVANLYVNEFKRDFDGFESPNFSLRMRLQRKNYNDIRGKNCEIVVGRARNWIVRWPVHRPH